MATPVNKQIVQQNNFDPLSDLDIEIQCQTRGYQNNVEGYKYLILSQQSQLCAQHCVESIIQETFSLHRQKQLMKYVDSFGSNYSIKNISMTVETLLTRQDCETIFRDYEDFEPVASAYDGHMTPILKKQECYDPENMVDVQFVNLPKQIQREVMNAGKEFTQSHVSLIIKDYGDSQSKISSEVLEMLNKSKMIREKHVGQTAIFEAERKKQEEPLAQNQDLLKNQESYQNEQEEAIKIFEKKLKQFPELAIPKVIVVKKKDKRNKNLASTEKGTYIDKEKITDSNGKEINFIKPNGDKISKKVPFFLKISANEKSQKDLKSLKNQSSHKKLTTEESKLDLKSQLIKSPSNQTLETAILPGQHETFQGKPILRDHYHQIEPTDDIINTKQNSNNKKYNKFQKMNDSELGDTVKSKSKAKEGKRGKGKGENKDDDENQEVKKDPKIQKIEFFVDKFMSQKMAEMLPIEPGVLLNAFSQQNGMMSQRSGGKFQSPQMSIEQFNQNFKSQISFEEKKEKALKYFKEGKNMNENSDDDQLRIRQNGSTQFLETELYIENKNNDQRNATSRSNATFDINENINAVTSNLLKHRKGSIQLPQIKSQKKDALKFLLVQPMNTIELTRRLMNKKTDASQDNDIEKSNFVSNDYKEISQTKDSPLGSLNKNLQSEQQLNPLIQRVKAAQMHKRQSSVAPKYKTAADEKSMYISPSQINFGIIDKIYHPKKNQMTPVEKDLFQSKSIQKKGYPNIFSMRSVQQSPQGSSNQLQGSEKMFDSIQQRQEQFLQKIQSEKRNMLLHKRFQNSGFGTSHNHLYFIRKIE